MDLGDAGGGERGLVEGLEVLAEAGAEGAAQLLDDLVEGQGADVVLQLGELVEDRGREQVGVDVTSVIRASPTSFRVAWVERRYRDGSLAETSRWTAILTIVVQVPRTPDALRKNPLGIFVNAINWSKELGS